MPSHPSATNTLISAKFPKSLKQPLAILACSVAVILLLWASVLRAAPQSQAPPPPAKTQAPADSSTPQPSRPALRVVQQMVQVDIIAKDHDGKPIENLEAERFHDLR